MENQKILSYRGYKILVDQNERVKLQRQLTVTPLGHPDYPFPKSFQVYSKDPDDDFISIPRWFGIKEYGIPNTNELQDHLIPYERRIFNGELRDSQLVAHSTVLDYLKKEYMGLLCLQTGKGKTVIAIKLLSDIGQKCIIFVHKGLLLEQWKKELGMFLPKLKIGIIQQTEKDFTTNCDVYIAMIQTMVKITESIPKIFGMIIVDEAHHVPSVTFSNILFKISTKYILGLTATPERKDGLTKVLHWHIGEIIYQEKADRAEQSTTMIEVYRYHDETLNQMNTKKWVELINRLCENNRRNDYIVNILKTVIERDTEKKRRILILTERKNHAILLHEVLKKINVSSVGLLIGGIKKDVLETEKEKDILVATYSLLSEGVSISHLNTLILASPKKDIVQSLGRIFRKVHTEINPMIIDISDSILRNQEYGRMNIYKKELNGNVDVVYYDEKLICTKRKMTTQAQDKEQTVIINWDD